MHGGQSAIPRKPMIIKFPSPRFQMPGVWAGDEGCWSFHLTDAHNVRIDEKPFELFDHYFSRTLVKKKTYLDASNHNYTFSLL